MSHPPNHNAEMVSFILQMNLRDGRDVNEAKEWITERAVTFTGGLYEEKSLRYEWFLSEDGTRATLMEHFQDSDGAVTRVKNLLDSPIVAEWDQRFEVTNFYVLGKVKDNAKSLLEKFDPIYQNFAGGFFK